MAAERRQFDWDDRHDFRQLPIPVGNCILLSGDQAYGVFPGDELSGRVQRHNSVLSDLERARMKKLVALTIGLAIWLGPVPARADDENHRNYYLRSSAAPPWDVTNNEIDMTDVFGEN